MDIAGQLGNVRLTGDRGELAQVLADDITVRVNEVIQGMSAGDQDDAPGFPGVVRTVLIGDEVAVRADIQCLMHGAVARGGASGFPVIGNGFVPVDVMITGIRGQLSGDAAGAKTDEAVILRRAVHDFPVGEPLGLVDFFHEALPERCGSVAAGGLGGQGLVIVMADPYGGGVPTGHPGEEHASGIGVRAGLAGDGLPGNPRLRSRTA